jgi:hypothetical protein
MLVRGILIAELVILTSNLGADVLVVAPTGMGKVRWRNTICIRYSILTQSLCFQIPAVADKVNLYLLNRWFLN